MLQHQNLSWDVPGGTIEAGENFVDTLQRELVEEAGAKLISYAVFGAWHCYSLAAKPYRPHLPHPEHYRIVGFGCVEMMQPPTNPSDGEKILSVATVSLGEAIKRFAASGRSDLSQLYQLASEIALRGMDIAIGVV
jgi:8-oxo-dGTP diphosphatase